MVTDDSVQVYSGLSKPLPVTGDSPPSLVVSLKRISQVLKEFIVSIVSPGNKSNRVEYRRFVRKIVDAVDGGLHALIIDPFPAILANDRGIHNIIWRQLGGKRREQQQDQPLTYVSYESDRNSFSHRCFLQPGRVGEPLPEMPLFLKTEQYIVVPLEECYETAMRDVVPKYRKILEGEASSP